MNWIQVRLTEKQAARLEEMSARRGVPVVALVRDAVDKLLAGIGEPSRDDLYRTAARPIGRFRSGRRDIAARHDAYLAGDPDR